MAICKVIIKLREQGAVVELLGLNEASATIVDRFGTHDDAKYLAKVLAKN